MLSVNKMQRDSCTEAQIGPAKENKQRAGETWLLFELQLENRCLINQQNNTGLSPQVGRKQVLLYTYNVTG